MTHMPPEKLLLSDLNGVIDAVAKSASSRSPDSVRMIMDMSDLSYASLPASNATPKALWTAAFTAALEATPETLAKLLQNIRANVGQEPWSAAEHALQEVRKSCISRCTLEAHPEVGDRADALLIANGTQQTLDAANRLRDTAISVRRLLLRPLLAGTFLQLQRELDVPFPDPDWLRMEIADQAVDVVTAVDYLLFLLHTPPRSGQLFLGGEPGSDRAQGRTDDETLDWLTRRQLDARGTAVRQGQRLLTSLRRHISTG
jgi:hypothetical protein